jgi:hypothetical protein
VSDTWQLETGGFGARSFRDPDALDRGEPPSDGVHRTGGESEFDRADRRHPGWRQRIRFWEDRVDEHRLAGVYRMPRWLYEAAARGLNEKCHTLAESAVSRGWFAWDRYGCAVVDGGSCPHEHCARPDHMPANDVQLPTLAERIATMTDRDDNALFYSTHAFPVSVFRVKYTAEDRERMALSLEPSPPRIREPEPPCPYEPYATNAEWALAYEASAGLASLVAWFNTTAQRKLAA